MMDPWRGHRFASDTESCDRGLRMRSEYWQRRSPRSIPSWARSRPISYWSYYSRHSLGPGARPRRCHAASRALSRPVADLRASALALGEGKAFLPPAQPPPVEFEQVFGAFGRMAADIRTSQAALEEARLRTATVLATVATGVIALDPKGSVLIANRRAEEILGIPLAPGDHLADLLGPEWKPLVEAVQRELSGSLHPIPTTEVEARGRRIRLQLAQLESGVAGVVVALNDLTDVSRAERVLAWGEIADR